MYNATAWFVGFPLSYKVEYIWGMMLEKVPENKYGKCLPWSV